MEEPGQYILWINREGRLNRSIWTFARHRDVFENCLCQCWAKGEKLLVYRNVESDKWLPACCRNDFLGGTHTYFAVMLVYCAILLCLAQAILHHTFHKVLSLHAQFHFTWERTEGRVQNENICGCQGDWACFTNFLQSTIAQKQITSEENWNCSSHQRRRN